MRRATRVPPFSEPLCERRYIHNAVPVFVRAGLWEYQLAALSIDMFIRGPRIETEAHVFTGQAVSQGRDISQSKRVPSGKTASLGFRVQGLTQQVVVCVFG